MWVLLIVWTCENDYRRYDHTTSDLRRLLFRVYHPRYILYSDETLPDGNNFHQRLQNTLYDVHLRVFHLGTIHGFRYKNHCYLLACLRDTRIYPLSDM
jgi:hypothetical protein